MYKISILRLLKWTLTLVVMILFPCASFLLAGLTIKLVSNEANHQIYDEYMNDLPLMLIGFYGGFLGAGCTVIVTYFPKKSGETLIETIAKFVLGGIVGVATFFVLKSGLLLKILYPKMSQGQDLQQITYYSVFIISIVAGISAPKLVSKIKSQL